MYILCLIRVDTDGCQGSPSLTDVSYYDEEVTWTVSIIKIHTLTNKLVKDRRNHLYSVTLLPMDETGDNLGTTDRHISVIVNDPLPSLYEESI